MYGRTLKKWCLKKYFYYLWLFILLILILPHSVFGMAILNSNAKQIHRYDIDINSYNNYNNIENQQYQKLINVPNYVSHLASSDNRLRSSNDEPSSDKTIKEEEKESYRDDIESKMTDHNRRLPTFHEQSRIIFDTRPGVEIAYRRSLDLSRNRRESTQKIRRRHRRFCHSQDLAARTFLAPTVFEGKLKSMSWASKPNISVTFQVKRIFKNQKGFSPLRVGEHVRLHFSVKAGPTRSGCDYGKTSTASNGVVRANLKSNKHYILFVERRVGRNYTVLGEPVMRTRNTTRDVQTGADYKYGKSATASGLQRSLSTRAGSRVKLVCRTGGLPPPRVTWWKDGRVLHGGAGRRVGSEARIRIIHHRRRSVLSIRPVTGADSGRYECRAHQPTGMGPPALQQTELTVLPIQENTTTLWPLTASMCPFPAGQEFCLNGGTCLYFKDVGEPACRCADGFNGQRCENKDVSNQSRSMMDEPWMDPPPPPTSFDRL